MELNIYAPQIQHCVTGRKSLKGLLLESEFKEISFTSRQCNCLYFLFLLPTCFQLHSHHKLHHHPWALVSELLWTSHSNFSPTFTIFLFSIQGIVTLVSEDVLGALWGSPELSPPVLFLLMQNSAIGSQHQELHLLRQTISGSWLSQQVMSLQKILRPSWH